LVRTVVKLPGEVGGTGLISRNRFYATQSHELMHENNNNPKEKKSTHTAKIISQYDGLGPTLGSPTVPKVLAFPGSLSQPT